MSISISKILNLPQAALKFLVQHETENEGRHDFKTIGGVLSDTDYAWLSNGPRLEVVHTKTGSKIGSWTFGWVLKDCNTQVVCVEEIQRSHGKLPLLAVGVDCEFSGGMICMFDFVTSKIIRAIQVKEKITKLHVIDAGHDVFILPSPLRNFDGILAVGTAGGDVFLVDMCKQICDEALTAAGLRDLRDELSPCQLNNITFKDIAQIEFHNECAVRNSEHLAVHLNTVFDKSTKHFILKGPKGDDRIHVNQDEVTVSALYYCPQLGSLLVGYNFGALQVYNLMNLELVYTSPVCEEHIPISQFAVQEPADDPRAFCYVWAVYSSDEQYSTCLPLAVMYAFCYNTKEYHEGYGFLYQDFNTAAIHYQMELGVPEGHKKSKRPRGGSCLKLKSISQGTVNRDGPHCDSNEDNVTLCVLVWSVWFSSKEIDTFVTIFDLNQWYKEQMPNVPSQQYSSTYMIQMSISNLISSATNQLLPILDAHIDQSSIQQYVGTQRLEEHFYPNSVSFGICCLRAIDIVHLQNYGVQKALLAQIESSGPLCLVEPAEVYQEIIGLGLIPLFIDLPVNAPVTTNQQREIILGAALENQLIGWLCKCASEWANGGYLSAGCSVDLLISWAFQRAIALKTNCDSFCVSLFDYSEARLDNNTNVLLNSCTRQLKNLCSLYAFIIRKLYVFVSNQELVEEQFKSLQMVSVYFEVLQWLLNVGLLPECPLTAYPRSDDMERISAPYPAQLLTDFYNHRRGLLKIANEESFSCSESVLFIDALIEKECGGKALQEQWRNDGGNGLYPPSSLQALLRSYLIDNVELFYKHSVIIYVFLDLAMTLDQEVYKPVITHLIKFPAVFKLSPSLIKITQAFWQLDHGDCNTAMGLLLDPLVLNKDLSQWHHKIALKSLLLQKQHNLALLYVKVRKPAISDEEDVKTAISLYIANDMLDEAFYFEKQFTHHSQGEKFLYHLFDECKKRKRISLIVYRTLSTADEKCFLKYLWEKDDPFSHDLQVYYSFLRARFLEAFDTHDRIMAKHKDNPELIGKPNAVDRDKIMKYTKEWLPPVNYELITAYQKGKNNICTQVSKPTPMSVFVLNANESAQYKSTFVGAALAKAKQTFNDATSDKCLAESEITPFLRAPAVTTATDQIYPVFISPRITSDENDADDILGPPSAKRVKLSPRVKNVSLPATIPSKLETPIVKRRTSRTRTGAEENLEATPHSILKVKSLSHTPNEKEFTDDFTAFEKLEYTPVTSKKSGLGLSPRKSLARSSPTVRFQGLKNSTSGYLDSSHNLPAFTRKLSTGTAATSEQLSGASSKNTSSEEDVFYSPNTSLDKEKPEAVKDRSAQLDEEDQNEINEVLCMNETGKKSAEVTEKPVDEGNQSISAEDQSSSLLFSPKSRRSLKRTFGSSAPVRSSPRLSKIALTIESALSQESSISEEKEELPSSSSETSGNLAKELTSTPKKAQSLLESESVSSQKESPRGSLLPKLRPRKSLCRKVLETNTANRMLNTSLDSSRSSRLSKSTVQHQEISRSEQTVETTNMESSFKFEDGEESHKTSITKKHSVTASIIESDLDTSEDFSINYDMAEEPDLSRSMLSYINSSKMSTKIDTKMYDSQNVKSDSFAKVGQDQIRLDETTTENVGLESDSEVTSSADRNPDYENVDNASITQNVTQHETSQLDNVENDSLLNSFNVTTTSKRDQSIYSVFESSAELFSNISKESGPNFSESMIRCINTRVTIAEEVEKEQEKSSDGEEELMEVDNVADDVHIYEDLSDDQQLNDDSTKIVYADLSCSSKEDDEEDKEDSVTKKFLEHKQSREKEKEESLEAESSSNRPIDPEMNVFEISHDLSINDGLIIEKEVTFEENDLCYHQQNILDQQSTLEIVLEENITSASSAPLNLAFEKNVFNEISSEEESNPEEDEESENEKHVEPKLDDALDVIEIGSSSDDQDANQEKSSASNSDSSYIHGSSDEDKLDVSYERHIYDCDENYSSESNSDRFNSSSESDDNRHNETNVGELFHGNILLEDNQQEDKEVAKTEQTYSASGEPQPEYSSEIEKYEVAENKEDPDSNDKNVEITTEDNFVSESEPPVTQVSSSAEIKQVEPRIFCEDESFEAKPNKDDNELRETKKDNLKFDETQVQCGLFYGEILIDDVQDSIRQGHDKTEVALTIDNVQQGIVEVSSVQEDEEMDEPDALCIENKNKDLPKMSNVQEHDKKEPETLITETRKEGVSEVTNVQEHDEQKEPGASIIENSNEKVAEMLNVQDHDDSKEPDTLIVEARNDDGSEVSNIQKNDDTIEPALTTENRNEEDQRRLMEEDKESEMTVSPQKDKPTENTEKAEKQIEINEIGVEEEERTTRVKTSSFSTSSGKSTKREKKTRQLSKDAEESLIPRRSTRRRSTSETKDTKSNTSSGLDSEVSTSLHLTQSTRVLRTRRVSTEESNNGPTYTLRKRSVSVDETSTPRKPTSKSDNEDEVERNKNRKQRASSVSRLPKISEEIDVPEIKRQKYKSVLENYSMTRRVTRRQMSMLQKTIDSVDENKKIVMTPESFDPTVILERLPLEDSPDAEDKKASEISPPSSNSTVSTSTKATRRSVRSGSQVSGDRSQRSKSKTPVRAVKGRSRNTSSDDLSIVSTQTNVGTSKPNSKESVKDSEAKVVTVEPRTTRSRTRSTSLSSVNSEDLTLPETSKIGRRKKKLVLQSALPEIQEDTVQSDTPTVPKKRTRRNSSQK